MLLGQHYHTLNTMWELRISANASSYGFLGFVINSTLNILGARGLAHSERQGNVKNVKLRNTELHNTKKVIYFTTSKIAFIKHPKKEFFCPVANRSFSARSARKTGCSLRGLSHRHVNLTVPTTVHHMCIRMGTAAVGMVFFGSPRGNIFLATINIVAPLSSTPRYSCPPRRIRT